VEVLPGQARVWQSTFQNEKPEALDWGFRQYYKRGKFSAKPADIAELIREQRESPYFAGWDEDIRKSKSEQQKAVDWGKAQASRQEYFTSPEYQQFLERMKRERGI
jgi:hypothetical protein